MLDLSSVNGSNPDEIITEAAEVSSDSRSITSDASGAAHNLARAAGGSLTTDIHVVSPSVMGDSRTPDDDVNAGEPGEVEDAEDENEEDEGPVVPAFMMTKFTLYETRKKMYILGSNARESRFRMLEIDLTVPKDQLVISDSKQRYTRAEVMTILEELENSSAGGEFTKRLTAWGLLGFIRFTEGYFMIVITKRSVVALIGGHYVYHVDGTDMIPLIYSRDYKKPDRRSDETRLISTFQGLDLTKTFYFSYTYDITHTLQYNIIREKERAMGLLEKNTDQSAEYQEMFQWNQFLLQPMMLQLNTAYDWFRPIMHGFVDQAKISDFGRSVLVTIIARRSHYFAGARFLKRGVNDQGNVANEVETEQIVTDHLTTSFHDDRDGIFNSPRYTSYVQHRGSIPLYWSQDVSNMSPKPPIGLNAVDPFYSAAALHFDDLFARYGSPVMVLNLIKMKERAPRETILGKEFSSCIKYLNQFLPEKSRIDYTAWDMSRAAKGRDQEVIDFLEKYAEQTLKRTGFFHNGKNLHKMQIQDGICRSNCIDCLDRTNAAQFVIAKKALAHQLNALGLIGEELNIDYDSDAVNLLTEMYHDHGDTIALQYGGSHLVNTMETYRKINQWTSHSRDMIESIRRFYSNSFIDFQRQEAINLFLGNYVWKKDQPALWQLQTDYFLHNSPHGVHKSGRSYQKWWIEDNLKNLHQRLKEVEELDEFEDDPLVPYRGFYDNYWNECYRPRLLTSFHLIFAYNMNSTLRYLPMTIKSEDVGESSPFTARKRQDHQAHRYVNHAERERHGSRSGKTGTRRLREPERERSISGSTGSDRSMRKAAIKRASMFYQNPTGISRMLSDRVFSAGKPKLQDTAILEEDEDDQATKPIGNTLNTDHANSLVLRKQVGELLEPRVDTSSTDLYQDYIVESCKTNDNEQENYRSFCSLPERIVSSDLISNENYDFYKEYFEKAEASSEENFVGENTISGQDESLAQVYSEWLATGEITGQ